MNLVLQKLILGTTEASLHLTMKSNLLLEPVFYFQERSEALASVPPLASFSGSSRVSMSLLLAARVDQSCIEPIKPGKSTDVYKV